MVDATTMFENIHPLRIRKRSIWALFDRKRLADSVVAVFFLLGSMCVIFVKITSAGVGEWTPTGEFSQITSGSYHTCGINAIGAAYCWGTNSEGELGNNSTTDSAVPVSVDQSGVLSGLTILSIKAGWYHTCALASDNNVYCWGNNDVGQLGNNTKTESHVPVAVYTAGVLSGKSVTSLMVGDSHSCVIASDDKAYCWGGNENGQLGDNSTTDRTVPVAVNTSGVLSGKNVLSLSGGDVHTCAIASDNNAYCWGYGGDGALGTNSTSETHVPAAVYTTGALSGKTILALDAGGYHTCAIASDNNAYCWGNGDEGALGNNDTSRKTAPTAVYTSGYLSGKTVSAISAADSHTCAIASDNNAYCWGTNDDGQLGDESKTISLVPYVVTTSGLLSGKTVTSIETGGYHTCAIASDVRTYCWGDGDVGQLGNGSFGDRIVADVVNYTMAYLKGQDYRFYADSATKTPGTPLAATDTAAQLANPGDTFRLRTGFKNTSGLKGLSSSHDFTCGIAPDNTIYCWGLNVYGQLGNNSTTVSFTPVAVSTSGVLSGKTITSVSAGAYHACAIDSTGTAYCWGHNDAGQLGNNSTVNSGVPVAVNTSGVLSGKTILSIAAGNGFTCAIASDNNVYCWGNNDSGQLGNNTLPTDSSVPVAVSTSGVLSGKTISSITTGGGHICAVASDSKAYCWGYNDSGQIGDNSQIDRAVPVAVNTSGVLSGKNIAALSAGETHTCARSTDGIAYCWGYNERGQVGNNSTSDRLTPAAVNTSGVLSGKTVLSIEAGETHTCAVASDNRAYCWGYNSNGQLGDNSVTQRNVPVAVNTSGVLSGKTITSVAGGSLHTCAQDSNNTTYCWGTNIDGQMGTGGLPVNNTTPMLVPFFADTYLYAYDNSFKLQFAQRSAATCSAQTTGFADVTNSSAIAYYNNPSVTNGVSISANANDPVATTDSTPETYIDQQGSFTNPVTINAGKTALWDFSLKDNALGSPNTTYCFRMVYASGSVLEAGTTQYPEIQSATGVLSLGFVDDVDAAVSNPTFTFASQQVSTTGYTTSSGTFGDSTRKLRVFNSLATNGWTVTLAPTTGQTATWGRSDSGAYYDFNDPTASASDGADLDTYGGQLSSNTTPASIGSTCSLTGLSKGGSGSYSQGSVDALTLMTASSSSTLGCNWDLTGVGLTQTIPTVQPSGTYTLEMTATVTAI